MSDHHVGQALLVRVLGQHVADVLALSQDRDAVGNFEHLVQLMRDDDQRLSVLLHVAHDGEQLVRLLRRQNGRRLIEDQDIRAAVQNLDDFHGLLLRHRHIVHLLVRIDVEAVLVADFLDALARLLEVQPSLVLESEDDVLGRGKDIDQLEVLMNHADPVVECILRRSDLDGFVVKIDLSLIRIIDAGEHVHERRLAASVLSEKGQDLTSVDVKVHPAVGDSGAKCFRDAAHGDGRRFSVQSKPPVITKRLPQ